MGAYGTFLQVGLVEEGVCFPFWVHKGTCVHLRASSVTPGPLAKLCIGSELVVSPQLRQPMLPLGPATQPRPLRTSTCWLRVQEPPVSLEHQAVSWPVLEDPDACRRGETTVTACALLSEHIFEIGYAQCGQQLTVGNSHVPADGGCATLLAFPNPAVARCHIALTSPLRQLLGVHIGQRVRVHLHVDDAPETGPTDVGVEVHLCPLDLSSSEPEVSSGDSIQLEHCRQINSVIPFLRSWWPTQLALGSAHPPGHKLHDLIPAGVVVAVRIDGGSELFFKVRLSMTPLSFCVAGGFRNGVPVSAKFESPTETSAGGRFGKPIRWAIEHPGAPDFQLPEESMLPLGAWLADARASILERFISVLGGNERLQTAECGLPRAGRFLSFWLC